MSPYNKNIPTVMQFQSSVRLPTELCITLMIKLFIYFRYLRQRQLLPQKPTVKTDPGRINKKQKLANQFFILKTYVDGFIASLYVVNDSIPVLMLLSLVLGQVLAWMHPLPPYLINLTFPWFKPQTSSTLSLMTLTYR